MAKPLLEQETQIKQLSDELKFLLNDLLEPYKFIFDSRTFNKIPSSPPGITTIKLNKVRTLLCLEHNKNEFEIENDNAIIDKQAYDNVRTILQKQRTLIPESKWDESFTLVKRQIVTYLIKENKLEDKDAFLRDFQKFINDLPEVRPEFIDCSRKLMEINFDEWEIIESEENDPRFRALEEIHSTMLASFELYKTMGENYIERRNQTISSVNEISKEEEEKNIMGINMFNVVNIPSDGNCFYSAVADQLRRLDINNTNNETYYTHEDLRALTIDYIMKNGEQEFCKNLAERLQAQNTDPLHGDLPSNIHSVDQYLEIHCKVGAWTDSGMVGALAIALDITLNIYHSDAIISINNIPRNTESTIKVVNLQFTGNHYNSLVARSLFELLPFEKIYPKQSFKIRRIFEILNELERGDKLDCQIGIIAGKLQLPQESIEKLKSFFNANNITKTQKTIDFKEEDISSYTIEDMSFYGRVLEKHGVDFDTQFLNEFTEDGLKTLLSKESLIQNTPRYISYNIGGVNKDSSEIHWVAIVLVKREEMVTVLYKDPKGGSHKSNNAVESLFKNYCKDKFEFFKHSQSEQEDDASCGPMTINNLEIMALKVRNANDEGKDGITELIKLFKGESGKIAFTTQDEVRNLRIVHSLYKKSYSKANLTENHNVDDVTSIVKKLTWCDNNILMKDGKTFNLVTIKEDGNSFYSAIVDQLRRLDIKMKQDEANNQLETYSIQHLKALTKDFIKKNKENESGKNLEERLQDPLGDFPSNIQTIDQFIALQSNEGACTDSGMVEALAQSLDITIKIYKDGRPGTYNASQDGHPTVKNIVNLQNTGNHYNSLVDVDTQTTINKKKDEIESNINKINSCYDHIREWGKNELTDWARKHKGQLTKNFGESTGSRDEICNAIAIMDRANELATGGQRLRDTQKGAILICMQTNSTNGHVSQINTGEGKTTIISVIGALKVMQGYKAHVITSNNMLAADGVKDKKLFYDLLNITTADNNPDEKYTDGPRACYSKDIVYGNITSFQFDWLRDSFEQLKTLGDINFHNIWVLLDEIDSLLIDQGSNIVKLSGPFPGMECLRYVYINIWIALAKTEEQVAQEILVKLKVKSDELANDFETTEDAKQLKYEEYEDILRESFLNEIKHQIKNQKKYLINKEILATHLHQYAEDSVEKWIEHAFAAKYQYNENVEYKISKDKKGELTITPVDNKNTGISMKNTILSNGLHQFLQIKHNLCLSYESLTSCYVSNLDYIKKYGSKLYGVTGTLGSMPERNLLGSVFNLEFSVVPPFKPRQFIQFPGKVSADDKFVNNIAVAALGELTRTQIEYEENQESEEREVRKPRAVLIICASILDAEKIYKEIDYEANAAGLKPKILKYRDESDAYITESTLDVGDIVIATNLAGRGTDFKTSVSLENNGGLHVIEAFLPCNKRVEDQGFGRTGRQGNKGTGQIIVQISELEALDIAVNSNENIDFNEIIKRRDELEATRLDDIADKKVTELEFKGQLFNKFSLDYGALKENNKSRTDVIKWIYVLRDLKEKWAFWLEKQAYTAENIKQIIANQHSWFTEKENHCSKAVEQEYKNFLKEAKPIIAGTISHNPFYSICLAERYLENCTDKSDREKAKLELVHALKISKNSDLLYSAHIKLFEIAIEDGGQVLERYKKAVSKIIFYTPESNCPDYKERAIKHLQKAAKALAIEYTYLEGLVSNKNTNNVQQESALSLIIINPKEMPDSINNQENKTVVDNSNLFVKHLHARLACLGAYKGNIETLEKQINGENVFEKIEDSIGSNDGVIIDSKVPRYLNKLDSQNKLKNNITDRSVNELEYVGVTAVYQLRKIHDVHEEVITGAQIQLGSAFALLACATVVPVLLPVYGPLASSMISEGITDIITALIQQGQSAFDKKDYIKGKVISYGITILTMGISAVMSSTKILNKAISSCRSLATKLRSVKGPFAKVCNLLAGHIDKLSIYLEKMVEKIEFAKKMVAEQAKHLGQLKDAKQLKQLQQLQKSLKFSDVVITNGQRINQIVTQAAIGAFKGVVISVAIEKIVIASLNKLMAELQPIIEKKVRCAVSTKIKCEDEKGTFNNLSDLELNQSIEKLFKTTLVEDMDHVSKEIALGILRHSNNWKMNLVTLAFESILSGIDIATYTNTICDKFIADLPNQHNNNDSDRNILIESIISKISEPISVILYGKIVAITGKAVVTLPKVIYRGYKKHQEHIADKKAIADMTQKLERIDAADDAAKAADTKCGHDAVSEILGFDKNKGSRQLADATNLAASGVGLSIEDTKQLFIQNGLEVTSCSAEVASAQFTKQDSDRGVVCLSNGNQLGHIIPVALSRKDNCLMVTEGGKNIPFDQYRQIHGFTNAEFVIPKGVNSTTLESVQHQCNLNRIVKATHPIDYVGQDDRMKFGRGFLKAGRQERVKQQRSQEKRALDQEMKKSMNENSLYKPPHSMKGSDVLKRSVGNTGGVSKAPGHATDHLTHKGFNEKPDHTTFAHGKKQQEYLANRASRHPEYNAKAKEAQEKNMRVEVNLPIDELLGVNLPPKIKNDYRQAKVKESGAPHNMKYVKIVIDPPAPGQDVPYHMQTMYPVTKEKKDMK